MYNQDQLFEIAPLIRRPIEWFVLGGPADGNEAQCAAVAWPGINILATEPHAPNLQWQQNNAFPKQASLLPFALGSRNKSGKLYLDSTPDNGHRSCSMTAEANDGTRESVSVDVVTLEWLHNHYGPFDNAFLWLDIEGYEYEALQGAELLFCQNRIQYVNLEFMTRNAETGKAVEEFMRMFQFELIHTWNIHFSDNGQIHHCDKLYEKVMPRGL